jgi:GntR family transcriptional regulator
MLQHWFHLNPRSGIPIYVQLKEQVKTAVAGGVLNPGDQMPSVRDLAVALVVNPNTIARAYSELEREGLLSVEQGRGTFISSGSAEPLLDAAERALLITSLIDRLLAEAYHLRLSPPQLQSIWEQRFQAWRGRLQRAPGKEGATGGTRQARETTVTREDGKTREAGEGGGNR